jgi:hypothetical protein
MPLDTILALICIIAAFVFFAGVLIYGDLTWQGDQMSGRLRSTTATPER